MKIKIKIENDAYRRHLFWLSADFDDVRHSKSAVTADLYEQTGRTSKRLKLNSTKFEIIWFETTTSLRRLQGLDLGLHAQTSSHSLTSAFFLTPSWVVEVDQSWLKNEIIIRESNNNK